MTRGALALVLLVAACTSEVSFDVDPPFEPVGNPLPLLDEGRVDTIVQVVPPIVDVLWVVDNSCSMVEEQEALTRNFPSFMDYFLDSGVDYHLGVVSTDLDDSISGSGRLIPYGDTRFITPDTKDPFVAFESMATVGTKGSGTEMGRGAVYLALEVNRTSPDNVGFYREDADIHSVIISDEDDDTTERTISVSEFVTWYKSLKRRPWRETLSSIVSPARPGPFDGGPYLSLTDQIGGIPWNIESPNWRGVLDRLGVQASGLRREFFLSALPVEGTIEVEIVRIEEDGLSVTTEYVEAQFGTDGELIAGDWVYDASRNSIRFLNFTPESLDEIVIRYTVLASASQPRPTVAE